MDFEPFSGRFGTMQDAQTAETQAFRTTDGWFGCSPAGDLAQMQEGKNCHLYNGADQPPMTGKPESAGAERCSRPGGHSPRRSFAI